VNLVVIPRPDRLDEGPGRWTPTAELIDAVDSVRFGAESGTPALTFEAAEGAAGAYRLTAGPNGISVTAGDAEGRWNAMMTLRQVLRQTDGSGTLPALSVEDAPVFAVRGVMLDISRTRIPTLATIRRLIDLWSELKVNQVQLYTEHTFAYEGHDAVWKDASPYTGADIEAIDAYCRDRGIELVPNQNSFGHMERWFRHPEYEKYTESPEGFEDPWGVYRDVPTTLDLSKPESLVFLESLFDQLLPHFSSRRFNIGGDEPFDLGKGSNRERCERDGVGKVYLDFLKRIIAAVQKRDRVPQFWADILLNYPELLPEVPRDVEVMNWGYEADHPFEAETAVLAETDRRFHVCPGTSAWNSLTGRWTNARTNIRSAAHWGRVRGAEGLLVTDWGDNGHKQQYVVSAPGWFAAAAAAWNGPSGADEDIRTALQIHLFGNPGGSEADGLLALGDLYRENPVKLHNMSFLILPLLDHEYPYYRREYPRIRAGGTGRARRIAGDVVAALEGGGNDRPGGSAASGAFWRRQLEFSARIAAFAADLAEAFFSAEDFTVERIPAERRHSLARNLEVLMDAYEALWREFCRPGGLDESLDGFSGLLELLKS